jgi:hypothetical protein
LTRRFIEAPHLAIGSPLLALLSPLSLAARLGPFARPDPFARLARLGPLALLTLLAPLALGCVQGGRAPGGATRGATGLWESPPLAKERSVAVDVLWVRKEPNPDPEADEDLEVAGITQVRLRVAPNPSGVTTIGVAEQFPGGAGDTWRAAVWLAARSASRALGREVTEHRFLAQTRGFIDGPSAGALFTAGFLAAVLGVPVRPEVTITGTMTPDGTVGRVGGVVLKLAAALKAGKRVIGYPPGDALVKGPKGAVQNLETLAAEKGARAVQVRDLYEAFHLLTGRELPKLPEATADKLALPRSMGDRLLAKAREWMSKAEPRSGQAPDPEADEAEQSPMERRLGPARAYGKLARDAASRGAAGLSWYAAWRSLAFTASARKLEGVDRLLADWLAAREQAIATAASEKQRLDAMNKAAEEAALKSRLCPGPGGRLDPRLRPRPAPRVAPRPRSRPTAPRVSPGTGPRPGAPGIAPRPRPQLRPFMETPPSGAPSGPAHPTPAPPAPWHPTPAPPAVGHPTPAHPAVGHPTPAHPAVGHPTPAHPAVGHPTPAPPPSVAHLARARALADAILSRARAGAAELEALKTEWERVKRRPIATVGEALAVIAAYAELFQGAAYARLGKQRLDRLTGLFSEISADQTKALPTEGEVEDAVRFPSMALDRARLASELAGLVEPGSRPLAWTAARRRAIADQLFAAAKANLDYLHSLLPAGDAGSNAQKLLASNSADYMTAELGISRAGRLVILPGLVGGKEPAKAMAAKDSLLVLGAAVSSFLASSQLLAKMFTIGIDIGTGKAVTAVGSGEQLTFALHSARRFSLEAAHRAAGRSGQVPAYARVLFGAADALRQENLAGQVKALELYWRAGLYCQLAEQIARPLEPTTR